MPPRQRAFFSTMLAVLLILAGAGLLRDLFQRADIWWTPAAMAPSLAEAGDRVQIFAQGKPLGTLLDQQQLWLNEQSGSTALTAKDVTLRFNNWDRVRARRAPLDMLYGFALGGALVLLIIVATDRLVVRPEKGAPAP
jgi:hypothetical protein